MSDIQADLLGHIVDGIFALGAAIAGGILILLQRRNTRAQTQRHDATLEEIAILKSQLADCLERYDPDAARRLRAAADTIKEIEDS